MDGVGYIDINFVLYLQLLTIDLSLLLLWKPLVQLWDWTFKIFLSDHKIKEFYFVVNTDTDFVSFIIKFAIKHQPSITNEI